MAQSRIFVRRIFNFYNVTDTRTRNCPCGGMRAGSCRRAPLAAHPGDGSKATAGSTWQELQIVANVPSPNNEHGPNENVHHRSRTARAVPRQLCRWQAPSAGHIRHAAGHAGPRSRLGRQAARPAAAGRSNPHETYIITQTEPFIGCGNARQITRAREGRLQRENPLQRSWVRQRSHSTNKMPVPAGTSRCVRVCLARHSASGTPRTRDALGPAVACARLQRSNTLAGVSPPITHPLCTARVRYTLMLRAHAERCRACFQELRWQWRTCRI